MFDIVEEIRVGLAHLLVGALKAAGEKNMIKVDRVPDFTVEVPREKEHGDFATNLAMLLAKPARMAPRKIAEILVQTLPRDLAWVEKIEIAGPGFINFYLQRDWVHQVIPRIIEKSENYGRVKLGNGQRVQVEFVSANPTGLLHMGNARGAALGDSIASILDFAGYDVTREFYINDAGNQMEKFGLSLEARYLQLLGNEAQVPEDGYHGEDIIDSARGFLALEGDRYLAADPQERRSALVKYALAEKLGAIKKVLADFGVHYDVWFSEQTLHDSGEVQATLDYLKEKGYIYEKDQALWFKATSFGVEKDEVVVRANGIPTYFAADIAYHPN